MKYKNSIYNVLIPTEEKDKITVWNTRSGAVLRLFPNVWNAIDSGNMQDDCLAEYIEGLSKQGIIVPEDFNEYNAIVFSRRIEQYALSKTFSLIVAPTLACNFHCEYCFEKGKNTGSIMDDSTQAKVLEFVETRFKNDKNI